MPVTSDIIDDASLESPQGHGRKHHRGHFEASLFGAANVRRTPPTSPPPRSPEVLSPLPGLTSPESFGESSFYSFPEAARSSFSLPLSPELPPHRPPPLISGLFSEISMNTMGFDDGELSTPSLTTPNSSRSTTPSPTEQFLSLPLVSDSDDQTSREPGSYRELINQYCFFTGTQSTQPDASFSFDFEKTITDQTVLHASPVDMTPKALTSARMQSPSPHNSPCAKDVAATEESITPTASRLNLHLDDCVASTPAPAAAS